MTIGIDARFLTHPQKGGFKTYTENLIRSILELDHENQYIIYIDRPFDEGLLPQNKNAYYRIANGTMPLLGMPIREQIYLRKQIARDRPDLLHFLCNTSPIGLSINYVLTLHDTIQIERKNIFRTDKTSLDKKNLVLSLYSKWVIKKAVKNASRIIAVSNFEKVQIVQKLGIPTECISVIHEAPNPMYSPANQKTIDEWRMILYNRYLIRKKYLLGVGYESRKNIPLLLQAFYLISSSLNYLDLVIVASNEGKRQHFQQLADQLNISDRVVILGKISDQDMIILYNLAEVFVFPSDREGFGLPPLEAIACGTPTIAMYESSLPEILGDGAYLIDGKDPRVWGDAIRKVVTNPDLQIEMIAKGLQRASQFNWQKCALETVQVYQQVFEQYNDSHPKFRAIQTE